ncbi:MAG: hypothetical protein Q8K75_12785 [Chlamydiales bacterium]|nr:hypothetical protein [Chlamydiales bacterium]
MESFELDFEIVDFIDTVEFVSDEIDSNIRTLESIGKMSSGVKVVYNPIIRRFEPCAAVVRAAAISVSWIPGISFLSDKVANACEAGSQYLYGDHWRSVNDSFRQVESGIVDTMIRADSLINSTSNEELRGLAEKVDSISGAALACKDGLTNIKQTYADSQELVREIEHFEFSIFQQMIKTSEAIKAKLEDRVAELEVDENLSPVDASEGFAVDDRLENASIKVTIESLPPEKATMAETRRLEKYQFNGESLKDILDRLSPQGRYSFAKFVYHWVAEKCKGGRSVRKDDPVALRLAPMRIGGDSLINALNKTPHRELAVLVRLILGDYHSRVAR